MTAPVPTRTPTPGANAAFWVSLLAALPSGIAALAGDVVGLGSAARLGAGGICVAAAIVFATACAAGWNRADEEADR